MRRTEQNSGEKRVFLGSIDRKNNLRLTYERLNLEEKAFISSTKFSRRQLLSRQNKLRQLQSREQGNRGSSFETRPKTRTSFPDVPGANESGTRGYQSNLTLPYSRNGLRSPGEGKRVNASLGKAGYGGVKQARLNTSQTKSNGSGNFLDGNLKDVSTEKRNEKKVPLKQHGTKVEKDSNSRQVRGSGLHVGDIIAYSARYGRRTEKPQKGSSIGIDREDGDSTGNKISQPTSENKNFAVEKQTIWKSNLDSFTSTERDVFDTTRSTENEDVNSTKHIQRSDRNVNGVKDRPDYSISDHRSPRVLSEKTTAPNESAANGNESTVATFKTDDRLPRDNSLKDSNGLALVTNTLPAIPSSQSDELASESQFITSSLEAHTQEADGSNVPISYKEPNPPNVSVRLNSDSTQRKHPVDQTGRPTSSVPALVSRTPSWTGTESLPALGRIRRGSFCDVKTFTSGKVLDLLSSCEIPSQEKKNSKQFLDVESENLKYCRYLRSATPGEAIGDSDSLEIPLKYRPSKNIIIGHTKVSPMQDLQ